MTFGLHEDRDRRRRQRRRRVWMAMLKWSLALGAIVAAGVYAHDTGTVLARREVLRLEHERDQLNGTVTALRRDNDDLRAAVAAAKERELAWQQRYQRDVPTDSAKELLELALERLAAGVEQERLKYVIGAAENRRDCADQPTTKRFIVKTRLYEGANDSVSFADNEITVTAEGATATNDAGNAEAWFDPAQPITARFTRLGGDSSEVSGLLPLHDSVVVGEFEHRFGLVAGPRGFVIVTAGRCRYP
jgi:hypothetical protein